jgi:hypothetical protein
MPANGINNSDLGEIVIYQPPSGAAMIDVRLTGETLWLTQAQIAELFQKERSVVTKHLRNIFSQSELERASVSAFFAHTAADGKTYQVEYFNLDAILSVGYRVNSRRGTQFRIWATGVLRDHLVRGYSANERRLAELRRSLRLVEHALAGDAVSADEATALLRVVTDYAYALDLLDDYDHQRVTAQTTQTGLAIGIAYAEARGIISRCARSSARPPSSAWKRTTACTARLTPSCRPRRPGCLSKPGGEGGASPLLSGEESQLRGRQQAHRGRALFVVHGDERYTPPRRRRPTHCGQRSGGNHPADRGQRAGREARDHQHGRESDQRTQLTEYSCPLS